MSQCARLLEAMRQGEVITPLRAFQITGSLACHSRIAELRASGNEIVKEMRCENGKRFGAYRLVGQLDLFE